jgi:hypothetical protein
MSGERRTKRRYAHELYPHPAEGEVRELAVEVPYLYARAIGFDFEGTSWFATDPEGRRERVDRTLALIAARGRALFADALLQGLTGQEAWEWAESRNTPDGEWIWERAHHYKVDPDAIKPYPCGPEPDHHDHYAEPDDRGWRVVTRVEGREADCPDCTEELPTDAPAPAAPTPAPQADAGAAEQQAAPAALDHFGATGGVA